MRKRIADIYFHTHLICILLVVGAGQKALAQSANGVGVFGKINIASPNAASLGKYGDIPVNYHTGVPNIQIPLYTIKDGPISLPISLSYHAGGLKVDENASWVGAGWTLMAGGAITRTVKDKPDERRAASMHQLYGYYSNYGLPSYVDSMWNNGGGSPTMIADTEPDLFSFQVNGLSGKFYFGPDRQPFLVPQQDVQIECVYTDALWNGYKDVGAALGRSIERFKITAPDGTKYYFGISEEKVEAPFCDAFELASVYSSIEGLSYGKVISSWFLYKIESADCTSTIKLNYKRDRYAFYTYPTVTRQIPYLQLDFSQRVFAVKNLMTGVVLDNIRSSANTIAFIPGPARLDVSRWETGFDENAVDAVNTTSPVLGGIRILDTGKSVIKKYQFGYDYFVDTQTPTNTFFSWVNNDTRRLKLVTLQESSGDDSIQLPPYRFSYFGGLVPRKMSFGKDHWGYSNGQTQNISLFPQLFENQSSINEQLGISIGNRAPSWPAMLAGTLSGITYPTGGSTNFEFEPHTVGINGINQIVGGLRVKSVTTTEPVMGVTEQTSFNYSWGSAGNISSGVLYSRPRYIHLLRNDWHAKTRRDAYRGHLNGCFQSDYDDHIQLNRAIMVSDNSLRPMESTQGQHIGYKLVQVTKGKNSGFSIYEYQVDDKWAGVYGNKNKIAIDFLNSRKICDATEPSYPARPLPHDFGRGDLLKEANFNAKGFPLTERLYKKRYRRLVYTIPGLILAHLAYQENGVTWGHDFYEFYEIETARIDEENIIDKIYDQSGRVSSASTTTFFESGNHNKPTKIIKYLPNKDTLTTIFQYPFSFTSNFSSQPESVFDPTASFIKHVDSVWKRYEAILLSSSCANGGAYLPCWENWFNSFKYAIFYPRKSLDSLRRLFYSKEPAGTYWQRFAQLYQKADQDGKALLNLVKANRNELVESSEWKNGRLINANLIKFSNETGFTKDVFPAELRKLEPQKPDTVFRSAFLDTVTGRFIADARYSTHSKLMMSNGNVIQQQSRDGVPTAYLWNYNQQYPVAVVTNAFNLQRKVAIEKRIDQSAVFRSGTVAKTGSFTVVFEQTDTADITFSMQSLPPNATVKAIIQLITPTNTTEQYSLCRTGSEVCSGEVAELILAKRLPGKYKLTIFMSTTFDSYEFSTSIKYTYTGIEIVEAGDKEFFYEGFEDAVNVYVTGGYTGYKAFSGDYPIPFSPPNQRKYKVQWMALEGGQWQFKQADFSAGMRLSGTIDEVRVLPEDAQITTYTYDSKYGLQGSCDPNYRRTFYEYDSLGRLKLIRDQDKQIIKTFQYGFRQ